MYRLQCFLVFTLLLANAVNSWDIALTAEKQIEFYTNGIKVSSVNVPNAELTALAYDAVYNLLLFVDKHSDNASIFSYNFTTHSIHPLVRKKTNEHIEGVTFDPVTGRLFWTDIDEKGIYYKSLREDQMGDDYGSLLIKLYNQNPRAIAVDSCRGYIYWTNIAYKRATISRARFDDPNKVEVVVDSEIFQPVSIVIDQKDKKMYWADDEEGIHYSIWSADLDGKNKNIVMKGIQHRPNSLTISKDSVFWIDWDQSAVWEISKTANGTEIPKAVMIFEGSPFGIVANYTIADQIKGLPECEALFELTQNMPSIYGLTDVPQDAGIYCLHGYKTDSMTCKCTPGYTGDRCQIPVCLNYCLRGECSLSLDGEPRCSCESGFTGTRCDAEICLNYCLNDGQCSINHKRKPVCSCSDNYEGRRCEISKTANTEDTTKEGDENTDKDLLPRTEEAKPEGSTVDPNYTKETITVKPKHSKIVPQPQPESCNCSITSSKALVDDGEFVPTSDCNGWDSLRDPILMVLGIICGMLCVACTALATKVMQLKKRPRIKKRIIVNKNVTPLTARPDQCEITIENCCNMNICETPCFEPRSTIRPTLLDSKPGKEEKRNLIANMELPDD